MVEQKEVANEASASIDQQAAVLPRPISQIDKLKLMIIRIGDEKRECRDEHLQKLKTQFAGAFVLKERAHRQTLTDTLINCIQVMPHKIMIYTALLSNLAVDEFDFAAEIVSRTVESLQHTLVMHGNIYRSKNIMRLLGNLVQIGLVNSKAFCNFLREFIMEYEKMPGAQEPSRFNTGVVIIDII